MSFLLLCADCNCDCDCGACDCCSCDDCDFCSCDKCDCQCDCGENCGQSCGGCCQCDCCRSPDGDCSFTPCSWATAWMCVDSLEDTADVIGTSYPTDTNSQRRNECDPQASCDEAQMSQPMTTSVSEIDPVIQGHSGPTSNQQGGWNATPTNADVIHTSQPKSALDNAPPPSYDEAIST